MKTETIMATIEERAKNLDTSKYESLALKASSSYEFGYMVGATEQKEIDYSDEHLHWIVGEWFKWKENNESCTFKQWIYKAIEGE